jgi:hypothetical protein
MGNMEGSTIRCSNRHAACAAPLGLLWYVDTDPQSWPLHITILLAMAILVEVIHAFIPLDQLGIPPHITSAMNTAGYVILAGTTITVTGLITGHLLLVQRRHIKLMGQYLMVSNVQ